MGRTVRSWKSHMKKVVGDHVLALEEFITILWQIEVILVRYISPTLTFTWMCLSLLIFPYTSLLQLSQKFQGIKLKYLFMLGENWWMSEYYKRVFLGQTFVYLMLFVKIFWLIFFWSDMFCLCISHELFSVGIFFCRKFYHLHTI